MGGTWWKIDTDILYASGTAQLYGARGKLTFRHRASSI